MIKGEISVLQQLIAQSTLMPFKKNDHDKCNAEEVLIKHCVTIGDEMT